MSGILIPQNKILKSSILLETIFGFLRLTLMKEAKETGEVTDMLSKNVERWIEEWKAEGKIEGKIEGKTEGIIEGLHRVARKLILEGMPIARISEITGLKEEEIKTLRDSVSN